jgi:lipopolysaccharide/colanic/teichoic acid biosynthesis glycosyltransferase
MIRIFQSLVPASVLTLFLSEALILFTSYALAAYLDPNLDGWFFLVYDQGWQPITALTVLLLFGLYLHQMYDDLRVHSRILLLQNLILLMGSAFLMQSLFAYLDLPWALPLRVLVPGSAFAITLLFAWRILFADAIRKTVGLRRVLFLGFSPVVADIAEHLIQHPELGFDAIGYVDVEDAPLNRTTMARIGSDSDILSVIEEQSPDLVVIDNRNKIAPMQVGPLIELRFGGLQIQTAPHFYQQTFSRICMADLLPQYLIYEGGLRPDAFNLKLQYMYSVALAVITLPLTLSVSVLIALLVRLGSSGPVLSPERRIGEHGVPFTSYRFRCAEYRSSPERFTALGHFLRRFGLDALPQVWSVLRGKMSFVGPDADLPEFSAMLNQTIPFHAQRSIIRPGITGWAQLNGSKEDVIRRLEYDFYYIQNLSLMLDLFIFLRWFREVLSIRTART